MAEVGGGGRVVGFGVVDAVVLRVDHVGHVPRQRRACAVLHHFCGEQPSRRGNKQLKRASFLSAFAALGDPASRANYAWKIAQGKHHTQALLCLARRRADVLIAMLRDGTFYEPQPVRSG